MRVSLADDRCFDVYEVVFARTLFHAVDSDCDSVRDLSIKRVKCLLTDDLCGNLSLRLVCYGVLIVEHRSVWQVFQNARDDILCVLVAQCRAWNDLIKFIKFAVGVDRLEDLVLVNGIDLVDHKDNRQM